MGLAQHPQTQRLVRRCRHTNVPNVQAVQTTSWCNFRSQSLQKRTCALRAVTKSACLAVCCLLGCRNLAAERMPACSHGALGDSAGAVRGALTVLYFTSPSSSSHKMRDPAVISCQTEDLGLPAFESRRNTAVSADALRIVCYMQICVVCADEAVV